MDNRRKFIKKSFIFASGVFISSKAFSLANKPQNYPKPPFIYNNSIWLPDWSMKKSLDSTLRALQFNCVRTASPFWYEVNNAGLLTVKPGSDGLKIPDKATVTLLKACNASVIPTITTTLMPDNFIQQFSQTAQQKKLAESIRNEVISQGYDGIDLDLEYMALTTDVATAKEVRDIYTALCQSISSALTSANKDLTITVMPRWSDNYEVWRHKLIPAVYDYKALSRLATVLRVMAYDQHAPNTPPGPIAGYEWVKNICHWTSKNVCAVDKVALGIPLYGRDWGGGKVKSIFYNDEARLRERYPASQFIYSDTEKEETFKYVSAEGSQHTVWYSTNQSVKDRLDLARRFGFRGAAFWAANQENPDLWAFIAQPAPSFCK